MTKGSTWTALSNPVFRKLWLATVISGICVAAHDTAALWSMNLLTASPFLISLMSTAASLPFFLFTLPAGALADKIDRRKLVCAINLWLAATAIGLAVLGWLHLLNPYLITCLVNMPEIAGARADQGHEEHAASQCYAGPNRSGIDSCGHHRFGPMVQRRLEPRVGRADNINTVA
jgi:hypothetical protein